MLWKWLKAKRFHGFKFRRQVPVGPFIVDFLCVEQKLVIEVDGATHYTPEARQYDRKREAFLFAQGLHVLRFEDGHVLENGEMVLKSIADILGVSQE